MVTSVSTVSQPAWIALAAGGPLLQLGRITGPSYQSTADPTAFAALLRATRPRIVLMGTPPAGPGELDVALHERRRRPSLRIVVVSPSDAIDGRLEALRAGADEAHADTMDPEELVARLTILEERTRTRHETVLSISTDTELDLVAHEVRRGGEIVHLRPKEFQLLAMLATHAGRAYTRRQLLDGVWGPGHAGDPRTVDVHIRWLRSKLEREPDTPQHLVTVRGVGYRLDPGGC
jgi:DNA-binding response OmpR family regulator